ncbi:MAG: hypothetical protein KatS3mg115_0594 [Candidatus Poribacteria bacterium]|nr:MAG: hypothetical protein KatS3mg115_0594 [Candidatus Poribacteria bacterium]
MSAPVSERLPAERVLLGYLLLAAMSTVLLRPPAWGVILLFHLLGAALVEGLRWVPAEGAPGRRLRILVPLFFFPLIYAGTGRINLGLRYWVLDEIVPRWEAALFGGQPSLYLSERLPWFWLSELLHAAYFSYYLLVLLLPMVLVLQGRERAAERTVAALVLLFSVSCLFYIWLPLTSPYYRYPPLAAPLSEGPMYRLVHAVSGRGGVVGGAFPSSHASLATLNLLLAWKLERRLFWWTVVPTFGLLTATVYCRFHYALDTLSGVAVGVGVFAASPLSLRTIWRIP